MTMNGMDLAEGLLQMEIIILANLKMDLKKAMENIHILTAFMKENLKKI